MKLNSITLVISLLRLTQITCYYTNNNELDTVESSGNQDDNTNLTNSNYYPVNKEYINNPNNDGNQNTSNINPPKQNIKAGNTNRPRDALPPIIGMYLVRKGDTSNFVKNGKPFFETDLPKPYRIIEADLRMTNEIYFNRLNVFVDENDKIISLDRD